MKTLLIYDRPVPLNREKHATFRLRASQSMAHARELNAIPVVIAEMGRIARDYPIVFVGEKAESVLPSALVGLQSGENLFVDAEGNWSDGYIPAFVRRYPFVLAEDGERFQIFIDEGYAGLNAEEGEALFDEEGKETEALKRVVDFLKEYQGFVAATQTFVNELNQHGLLEAKNLQSTPQDGSAPRVIQGMWTIDEEKLKKLSADTAQSLLANGAMGLIYAHLLSLQNLDKLDQRFAQRRAG